LPTRDCTGHTGRAGKRAAKTLTKEPIRSRGGHPGHDQGRRLSIPLVVAPQDLRIIVSKSTRQHRRCRPPGKTLLHGTNSKGQFDELYLHDPQNGSRQRLRPITHRRSSTPCRHSVIIVHVVKDAHEGNRRHVGRPSLFAAKNEPWVFGKNFLEACMQSTLQPAMVNFRSACSLQELHHSQNPSRNCLSLADFFRTPTDTIRITAFGHERIFFSRRRRSSFFP